MSKGRSLRALVAERLTAAAEEVFALVERTMAEYEEELSRSKEENQRKQRLLERLLSPPQAHGLSSDVQIQTERRSEVSIFKQEEEKHPDVACVIVKSEGDYTDIDCCEFPASPPHVETEAGTEACSPGPETTGPQTTDAVSAADVLNSEGADKVKKCPVGKRKRGKPRRMMAPLTDASETPPQQRPTPDDETREETLGDRGEAEPDRNYSELMSSALQTEPGTKRDAVRNKDLETSPAPNFQINMENEEGPSLDQVDAASCDRLQSDAAVSESEECLRDVAAACGTSNEQTERSEDGEDWSYDWQPQPGSSRQLLDSDDEDYATAAENDHPFMELGGRKASTKSGKTGSDAEGKVKHECPVCRKKLGRKQELKRHMLLHTGEKPFSCPVCDKRFIQKSNLKSHIVTHLDSVDTIIRFQKPMEVSRGGTDADDWGGAEGDLCSDPQDKLTDNLSDSDNDEDWTGMMEPGTSGSSQQMETEPGDDDSSSLERISLLLHQALNESKARGKTTEFQCPMCDKIFGRMENLRRHLLVHTGEKAFSCPVCSKQFTLKQHLKLHMVLHTRDQQFACTVCSKTFIRKDNLRSHMRIHSTDRPFGCSECGARFYTAQDLARHTAHHTGDRPFVCPVCNSGFLSRRYLNRHVKIHKKEAEKAS